VSKEFLKRYDDLKMLLEEKYDMKSALTHGGKFHADDVFCSALLKIIFPEIEIIRANEVPEDYKGIVFDVGMGAFDHHQMEKELRSDNVAYAAFGLLWREYGSFFLGEQAEEFDRRFIEPLDQCDNFGTKSELADIIGDFNPGWDSFKDKEECFCEAVTFAIRILENKFEYYRGEEKAQKMMLSRMQDGDGTILVLDRFIPWKRALINSDYKFVIYPSQRGGFNAQGVPVSEDTNNLKCGFPAEWRGLEAEKLQEVTGLETLRFCHTSGFLLAGDSRTQLRKACELALEQQEMNN